MMWGNFRQFTMDVLQVITPATASSSLEVGLCGIGSNRREQKTTSGTGVIACISKYNTAADASAFTCITKYNTAADAGVFTCITNQNKGRLWWYRGKIRTCPRIVLQVITPATASTVWRLGL